MCRARSSRARSVRPTGRSWGRQAGVVPNWRLDLYDEILFNGATFGDLNRGNGPLILASATDISTGSRFVFTQRIFDVICSDLNAVRLSRAAASSSAVPVVLSPVTLNNYGGTCHRHTPAWVKMFVDTDNPPRPAARAIRSLKAEEAFGDGVESPVPPSRRWRRVGQRGHACRARCAGGARSPARAGVPTPLDQREADHRFRRQFAVVAADHLGRVGEPPGTVDILLKSAGTPIDAFSFEAVELLQDTAAQWQTCAADPQLRRDGDQQGPCSGRRAARPGCRDLRHRRVVRRAQGQGGARLSESAADVVRAAARGRRSPARRGGHDHPGLARIQATAEGCRRQDRRATTRCLRSRAAH